MGLDMHLYAKRHAARFGGRIDGDETAFLALLNATGLAAVVVPLEHNFQSIEVEVQVAYWRKANQIHAWFVNNVQNGVDDCGDYEVAREALETLKTLCEKALAERDPSPLPPQSGFFFGSTEVDEYYWEDIELTIAQLTRILSAQLPPRTTFSYHSSW